jgi:hypothetical protein
MNIEQRSSTRLKLSRKAAPAQDNTGIVISVPDLVPGKANPVTSQPGFIGRAVLLPPGTNPNAPNDYIVVAYVTRSVNPISVPIPNVTDVLFADLPNGLLPPPGYATIFDALSAAIGAQIQPNPPTGTGNDHP